MDKKITDYYEKAQRIIDETDGALLTYQERQGGKVVTNTLVTEPKNQWIFYRCLEATI